MKIKQEVLVVLSAMECVDNEARIVEQLDRKLYVEVDKVLKALGGKWNRGAKAHLFTGDAASLLDAAILTGEVTTNREIGFFETPGKLAQQLVAMADVREGHTCLEPSAGTGNLVIAMVAAGAGMVKAVEYDETRRDRLAQFPFNGIHLYVLPVRDFMNLRCGSEFDRVVMNPPFTKVGIGDHLDHVRRAFVLLKPGGVLVSVLPSGVTFRRDRRHASFRDWVEQEHGTIEPLPDDSFKASGTGVCTVVLRVRKGESK